MLLNDPVYVLACDPYCDAEGNLAGWRSYHSFGERLAAVEWYNAIHESTRGLCVFIEWDAIRGITVHYHYYVTSELVLDKFSEGGNCSGFVAAVEEVLIERLACIECRYTITEVSPS